MTNDEAMRLAREYHAIMNVYEAQKIADRLVTHILSGNMKREIENAAYERAAKEAEDRAKHADQFGNYSSTYYQGFDDGADEAALAIRALITPAKTADTEG